MIATSSSKLAIDLRLIEVKVGRKKAHDFGLLKGNPFSITFRQHFLPNGLMKHFSTQQKKIYRVVKPEVHVELIEYDRYDDYAISLRAWDNKTEKFFTTIEGEFYRVRDNVASGVDNLSNVDCVAISNFLASWKVRPNYRSSAKRVHRLSGIPDPKIPPEIISEWIETTGEPEAIVPQYIREHLEKGGHRLSGVIQDYELNSSKVRGDYEKTRLELKNISWVVHRLSDLEIVLPDVPEFHFVPINPSTILLPNDSPFDTTSVDGISNLNYTIITGSKAAYWCHDINRLIKLP